MRRRTRILELPAAALVAVCAFGILLSCNPVPKPVPAEYALPEPSGRALETRNPPGFLPGIGRWMIDPSGDAANWMGQMSEGRQVLEPINVLILDPVARDATEAEARLEAATKAAGFQARSGHSSGYGAIIGGYVYPELPRGPGDSYSDLPFLFPNNHGRIFGPHRLNSGWLFAGAFSREGIDLSQKIPHVYESMNRARDAFVRALCRAAGYEISGYIDLDNVVLGDPALAAGDHDGIAVLVQATR